MRRDTIKKLASGHGRRSTALMAEVRNRSSVGLDYDANRMSHRRSTYGSKKPDVDEELSEVSSFN